MITIKEVKTNKDIRDFITFPLKLYKGCDNFVPPLYADERALLKSGGNSSVGSSVFYLALRDGKVVGRIQGILQKQYNQMHNEKRIRFTRFDAINDKNVASALFSAVERWGKELGMDTICGPLGFNDLEREGLLIEGFDENSTFEEQYNYAYYKDLIEGFGFEKEIDWLEFELTAPEKKNEIISKVAKRSLEMNKLHIASKNMSKKAYIEKYSDGFFDCLDACYSKLYGTVPIEKEQRKELISQFITILNMDYIDFVCDENDRVVAFALAFPNIGEAVKKSGGKLTLPTIIKLVKLVKKPTWVDLGLIAVLPEYQNTGVNAVFVDVFINRLCSGEITKCETNLNLETNTAVMSQWVYVNSRQHKRRRAYIKSI